MTASPPVLRRVIARRIRQSRLRLTGLPTSLRVAAIALLALAAVTLVVLVFLALGWPLPGGTDSAANFSGRPPIIVSRLALVLILGSLAVLAPAATLLAVRPGIRWRRVMLLLIGAVGLSFTQPLLAASDDLHQFELLGTSTDGIAAWRIFGAAAWFGIAACVLIVFAPRRLLSEYPVLATGIAALPYVGALAAFLLAGGVTYHFAGTVLDGVVGIPPDASAWGLVAGQMRDTAELLTASIGALVLWQAIGWARAGRREFGVRVAMLTRATPVILFVLLGAKLVGLAAGYALAPGCEASGPFRDSRCDGESSWLLAIGFAAVVATWLAWPRRLRMTDRGVVPAAVLVVAGFSAATIINVAFMPLQAIASTVQIWPASEIVGQSPFPDCLAPALTGGPAPLVFCLHRSLDSTTLLQAIMLGTVAVAVVVGAYLLRRPRQRPIGAALLVFGAWAVPRALDALVSEFHPGEQTGHSIGIAPATFDTVLTLALLLLAVLWWRGAQRRADPASLALVLVVSTLMTHAGTIIPAAAELPIFYVALALPLAYAMLFDSEGINRAGPERPTRVLGFLALGIGLLCLSVAGLASGYVDTAPTDTQRLAGLIFLPPFAAVFVAATIDRMSRHQATPSAPAAPDGLA
ncbi:MAG: hypothetical protein ABIZ34_04435 [Candidatus Limnocylindrales bacterium]